MMLQVFALLIALRSPLVLIDEQTRQKEQVPILAKLQGEWVIENFEYEGTNLISSQFVMPGTDWRFRINKDMLTIHLKIGEPLHAELVIDAKPSPKHIDVIFTPEWRGKGIFAVDNNILMVCIQLDPKKERPTEFNTTRQQGARLYILRKKS